MIVKHVPMNAVRKSNFGDLLRYLSDPQDREERVGDIRITNCHADELADATLEIMAMQARNTRAEGDKTYHLIISFRSNEEPPAGALADIEQRICVGLGFGEHQRISAVHHDTDNLHLHVAINKIHPTRLTMNEPFRAYPKLAELCATLEAEYGLERDNHQARKHGAENRASDMERAAGIESLLGWMQRECLEQIQGVQSWAELHQVLSGNDIVLRERGNGFVFEASCGTTVKASSVSRELSKAKLEGRLGEFQPLTVPGAPNDSARQYQVRPVRTHVDTSDLYAAYQAEQQGLAASRLTMLATARDRKTRELNAAIHASRVKRSTIKLMNGSGTSKKILYALASKALRQRVQKIQSKHREERQTISQKNRRRTWNDWLQHRATSGDKQALEVLRARRGSRGLSGNTVSGQKKVSSLPLTVPDHITKQGTLIYRFGNTAIRDDGDTLKVSRMGSQEGLIATLQLASKRYGDVLAIDGSPEFKEQLACAAVAGKLTVRFLPPEVEKRRLALLAANRTDRLSANHPRGVRR